MALKPAHYREDGTEPPKRIIQVFTKKFIEEAIERKIAELKKEQSKEDKK